MNVRKKTGPKTPDTEEKLVKKTVMLDSATISALKSSGRSMSAQIRVLAKKSLATA